jgi:hypothetical protein
MAVASVFAGMNLNECAVGTVGTFQRGHRASTRLPLNGPMRDAIHAALGMPQPVRSVVVAHVARAAVVMHTIATTCRFDTR